MVSVVANPRVVDPSVPVALSMTATDDIGVTSQGLTVNGTTVTLDAFGQATYTPVAPGVYTVVASAQDAAANNGTATTTFSVRDSSDTTPPQAAISTFLDLVVVSQPTDIVGTADDINLLEYTLSYTLGSAGTPVVFATGTSPVVNGTLGTLDPTMLKNGLYRIELQATDVNGASVTDDITVTVEGNMKIGVFALSFVDLQIPLGGIPITVTRSYDSRVKTQEDFGIGWDLAVSAGRLTHNRSPAEGWTAPPHKPVGWIDATEGLFVPCVRTGLSGTYEAPGKSHTTEVRLSDAESYSFKPNLTKAGRAGGGCLFDVEYQQTGGTAPGATLDVIGNRTVWYQFNTTTLYNDLTLAPFNPQRVLLTTYDGRVYEVDKDDGVVLVEDPRGNQLSTSNTGIYAYSGGQPIESVTFQRDVLGRIDGIVAPGSIFLDYVYDAQGDLVSFVDAGGYSTNFTYDSRHNLEDIFDPLGNRAIRSEYDTQGRLTATVDASGYRSTITHDLASRRETVTDRNGYTRYFDYDTRGNVVTETYPGNETISWTYDARDNQLTETNELGVTTTWGYDSHDRRTSEAMTVNGNLVQRTWAYDVLGNMTAETDPLGNTVSSTYDVRNLIQTRTVPGNGGSGFTSTFNYDVQGQLTKTCNPEGGCRTSTYDSHGRVTREVDERKVPTIYAYDTAGRMTTSTSTRSIAGGGVESLVTTYRYDARGLQTQTDASDGSSTQVLYDGRGLVTSRIDELARTTSYEYDTQGHLTLVRRPDQTTELTGYDAEGRITSRTDRMGRTRTIGYDPRGRMTSNSFDGASSTYTYDTAGRLTATTDRRGFTTTQLYDEAGRVTETRTPEHATTQYPTRRTYYDDAGRMTGVRDAKNRLTTYAYDSQGQLTLTTYPDSTTESAIYDSVGRVTSKTDRGGTEVQHGYDGMGNLTSVTNVAASETWIYAHDEQGNLTAITDPNAHTRTFAFDGQGREISRKFHIGSAQTRSYDERGNLTRRSMYDTSVGLGHTDFKYDTQDRLTQRNQADGKSVGFTYWPNGQRKTATDIRGGVTRYYYDTQDRLTYYEQPDGTSLSYGYDSAGNLTARTADVLTAQWTDGYSYDSEGRVTTVTAENPFTQVTEAYGLGYDATGQLTSLAYPNGLTTTYGYDAQDQLTRIQIADGTPTVVEQWDYARLADGNIDVITNLDGATQKYGYDAADRLTSEVLRDAQDALLHTRTYEYDPAGNRTRVTYASASGTGGFDQTATYDARDRLQTDGAVTFAWDEDGRMLSRSGSDGYALRWDSEDRLTQADYASGISEQHAYNPDGVLVETLITDNVGSSTRTAHLVDTRRPLTHVVADLYGSSRLRGSYLRSADLLLCRFQASAPQYYHSDHLGSVRRTTNTAGASTGEYRYTPFGVEVAESGGTAPGYLFAGERQDSLGILGFHRARMLSKEGVFLSIDPWSGEPSLPATLARHTYVGSNPINALDPSGLIQFTLVGVSLTVEINGNLHSVSTPNYAAQGSRVKSILESKRHYRTYREARRLIARGRFTGRGYEAHKIIPRQVFSRLRPELQRAITNGSGRWQDIPARIIKKNTKLHQQFTNAQREWWGFNGVTDQPSPGDRRGVGMR